MPCQPVFFFFFFFFFELDKFIFKFLQKNNQENPESTDQRAGLAITDLQTHYE